MGEEGELSMAGEIEMKQWGGSLIRGEDHTPRPGPRLSACGTIGNVELQKLNHGLSAQPHRPA